MALRQAALVASITLVVSMMGQSSARCDGPCGVNFEAPEVTASWMHNNLGGAVLHVFADDEKGTAYLIDAARGYALTARHVLFDDADNPHRTLTVTTPSQPGDQHSFSLLAALKSQDVALIQLRPLDALKDVMAFDISPRVPTTNGNGQLFTMGYPGQENGELSFQKVDAMRPTADRMGIEIKQLSFPGDSGSPLVDVNGNVVGTCLDRLKTAETITNEVLSVATYRFTASVIPLLKKIPPNERMLDFDKRLRSGTLSRKLLDVQLQPSMRGFTNVELLTWALWLETQPPAAYANAASLIACPILVACSHRKLDDVVLGALLKYATAEDRVSALLTVVERAAAMGQFAEMLKVIDVANDQFSGIENAATRAKFTQMSARQAVYAHLALGDVAAVDKACRAQLSGSAQVTKTTEDLSDVAQLWNHCATGSAAVNNATAAKEFLLTADVARPAAAPAPPAGTADAITREVRSGPVWSGEGKAFSNNRLCSGPAPAGYILKDVQFRLVGDRSCGAWSICKQTQLTRQTVCYDFSLQGHDEWVGLRKATSEGVLTLHYVKAVTH